VTSRTHQLPGPTYQLNTISVIFRETSVGTSFLARACCQGHQPQVLHAAPCSCPLMLEGSRAFNGQLALPWSFGGGNVLSALVSRPTSEDWVSLPLACVTDALLRPAAARHHT
jgi:hypothetical protein